MTSLDSTRHPAALSERATDAVPAKASCARPGVTPSWSKTSLRKGRSFVLLPIYRTPAVYHVAICPTITDPTNRATGPPRYSRVWVVRRSSTVYPKTRAAGPMS